MTDDLPEPLRFTPEEIADARAIVARHLPPTPQFAWPLLAEAVGAEVWVKHENHSPVGAFKLRGGLVLTEQQERDGITGPLVTSTRGNHGQSLARAGALHGRPVTIVVPEGNSPDKNEAMRALGATVVVHGHDYQASREHATRLAGEQGGLLVPPFHRDLVRGVATYALELFEAAGELDAVYVPIGMGSGVCGVLAVRDLLGYRTRVVGVVAAAAPAYALSVAAGRVVTTEAADTLADGVSCRVPDPLAVATVRAGVDHVVRVTDAQITDAMRLLFRTTHNVAEPTGAVALAGRLADPEHHERSAVVLTGGNADAEVFAEVLRGGVPVPA